MVGGSGALVEIVSLGDVHVGRRTETFDSRVLDWKLRNYLAEVVLARRRLTSDAGWPDESVLVLLGDMVDGEEIYPAQGYEQEMDVHEQIEWLSDRLEWLVEKGGFTRVVGVSGNHGRSNRRGKGNWDWALYTALDGRFKVEFEYTRHGKTVFKAGGLSVLAWHPYEVRMYMSLPFYGLSRQGLLEAHLRSIDLAVLGHFHQLFLLPVHGVELYGNGSMLEGDELSMLKGWVCDSRYWYLAARGGRLVMREVVDAGCAGKA